MINYQKRSFSWWCLLRSSESSWPSLSSRERWWAGFHTDSLILTLRPADGEHRPACPVAAAGLQPAHPLPAAGTRLRRACPALHRQRGAEERGGKVQRFTAHHTEGTGTHSGHFINPVQLCHDVSDLIFSVWCQKCSSACFSCGQSNAM